MQVSSVLESDNFAVLGGAKAQKFTIHASAHTFKILSDALYSDKPLAIARETICNAIDAHVMAGTPDRPVEISLSASELVIKDYGPGIPHDKIVETYCNYFGSTKTSDDSQIGGFGLGCKAPFCLTDHFMVTDCHGGLKKTYLMTMGGDDTDGEPGVQEMGSIASDEVGVSVKIPLESYQYRLFEASIKRVLATGGIKATINGVPFQDARDYTGIEQAGYGFYEPTNTYGGRGEPEISVLYGQVLYPIDCNDGVGELWNKVRPNVPHGYRLVFYAPSSSLTPKPDREALGYSDKTCKTINRLFQRFLNEVQPRVAPQLKKVFLRKMQGFRRHQFAEFANSDLREFNHRFPRAASYVGAEAASALIAHNSLHNQYRSDVTVRWRLNLAAMRFYRDKAKLLRRAPEAWSGTDVANDQWEYTMRRLMRVVMPVLPRPDIMLRFSAATKLVPMSKWHKECHGKPLQGRLQLTIAPTRAAAVVSPHCGIIIITKLTDEQTAQLEANAKRLGVILNLVGKLEIKPREARIDPADISPLFTAFSRYALTKKSGSRYGGDRYLFSDPSIEKPVTFLPLKLTKKKVAKRKGKAVLTIVQPNPPEEEGFVTALEATTVEKFLGLDFIDQVFEEDCAIPLSTKDRERLIAAGAVRVGDYLVEGLRKRLSGKKTEDAFTAIAAMQGGEHSGYGWSHNEPRKWAVQQAARSRRMACAVFMQPYRESKALDEVWRMWRQAKAFFTIDKRGYADYWFDVGEKLLYDEQRQEFEKLVDELKASIPKEMQDFLVRLNDTKLKPSDVAHLNFACKILSPSNALTKDEYVRLARMIESEGKRYLAEKNPEPVNDNEEEDDE